MEGVWLLVAFRAVDGARPPTAGPPGPRNRTLLLLARTLLRNTEASYAKTSQAKRVGILVPDSVLFLSDEVFLSLSARRRRPPSITTQQYLAQLGPAHTHICPTRHTAKSKPEMHIRPMQRAARRGTTPPGGRAAVALTTRAIVRGSVDALARAAGPPSNSRDSHSRFRPLTPPPSRRLNRNDEASLDRRNHRHRCVRHLWTLRGRHENLTRSGLLWVAERTKYYRDVRAGLLGHVFRDGR